MNIRSLHETEILLNGLVKTSYEIAKEKGWWDSPRPLPLVTLLILSEISEALEDFRNGMTWDHYYEEEDGKPCGPPSEMADVMIRIADYCGHLGYTLKLDTDGVEEAGEDFEYWANREAASSGELVPYWLAMAAGSVTRIETNTVGPEDYAIAALCVMRAADWAGFDLWDVIARKTAYNRTRPYRHGGKKA